MGKDDEAAATLADSVERTRLSSAAEKCTSFRSRKVHHSRPGRR